MTRITKWIGMSLAAMGLLASGAGVAHEGDHGAAGGKQATIAGEVIDVACYVGDAGTAKGEKHKECATKCISGGLPVGILTDDGKIILAVTADHASAKDLLLPYVAARVKASGTLSAKGGVTLLAITKVEPAGAKAEAAGASSAKPQVKEVWVCPMGCEGKTFDQPGKCPVCGMDLIKKS